MTAYENKRKQGDTDMAEKNLIKVYVNASSSKRVNLIIKNYNDWDIVAAFFASAKEFFTGVLFA